MCLAQGHNTLMPVRLEPATVRYLVNDSTTEPLCSQNAMSVDYQVPFWIKKIGKKWDSRAISRKHREKKEHPKIVEKGMAHLKFSFKFAEVKYWLTKNYISPCQIHT